MINIHKIIKNHTKIKLWSAIIWFILLNWFAISLMWMGRSVPPEIDDSYSYISKISIYRYFDHPLDDRLSIFGLDNSYRIEYLPWTFILGKLGRLFLVDAYSIYIANFYIGIVIAALLITWCLNKLIKDTDKTAFIIFLLSEVIILGDL